MKLVMRPRISDKKIVSCIGGISPSATGGVDQSSVAEQTMDTAVVQPSTTDTGVTEMSPSPSGTFTFTLKTTQMLDLYSYLIVPLSYSRFRFI